MAFENLLVETRQGIGYVTLNRPRVLNALNRATLRELGVCFEQLAQDEQAGAVILTGAGEKAFAAGADINELATQSPAEGKEFAVAGQAVMNRIERLGKPVIAAVNGHALGGGCELAMACTLRIASETARLGQPEVKLGIIPGYGGTQRLARLIGGGRALELVLTGEPITAQEALRIGLVNEVVPPAELLPRCEGRGRPDSGQWSGGRATGDGGCPSRPEYKLGRGTLPGGHAVRTLLRNRRHEGGHARFSRKARPALHRPIVPVPQARVRPAVAAGILACRPAMTAKLWPRS